MPMSERNNGQITRERRISLAELKELELQLLLNFTSYCDAHHYTYWLGGGTLLGAVRHQGFIPWDDDIDIMMPREDYEQALRRYAHPFYAVESIVVRRDSWLRYARLNDTRTVLRSNYKASCRECVFIDIFPIDGLPRHRMMQEFMYAVEKVLITGTLAAIMTYTPSNRYHDREDGVLHWKYWRRTLVKYLLISLLGKTRPCWWARAADRFARRVPFQTAATVGCLVSGPHGTKEIMPREVFSGQIPVRFEGHTFHGLPAYDAYLSKLYGDYRKLPPVKLRQTHHDFVAYWND